MRVRITRERGTHNMERILCSSPKPIWTGEARNNFKELHNRAGPAMSKDQRCSLLVWRPLVYEVQIETININQELIESIDRGLCGRPVKTVAPVGGELAQIVALHAIGPLVVIHLVRPARIAQPS